MIDIDQDSKVQKKKKRFKRVKGLTFILFLIVFALFLSHVLVHYLIEMKVLEDESIYPTLFTCLIFAIISFSARQLKKKYKKADAS